MSAKRDKIEELITKAEHSLRRSTWFEAERMFVKALAMARQEQMFDLMARSIPPLWEVRRQRFQAAVQAARTITIVDEPFTEELRVRPGCYLVQPPLVGLDARRLRMIALGTDVPIAVTCREPLTQNKLVPVVAISPSSTVRARLTPPNKSPAPEKNWFLNALRDLGDTALEGIDPTLPLIRRIDLLVEYIDALPEHEHLHLALEAACKQAHSEGLHDENLPPVKTPRSRIKS